MASNHPLTRRLVHVTILRKVDTVEVKYHVRSNGDARRFVDRYTVEYRDDRGDEYRKAFEVLPGVAPILPAQGTHQDLNGLARQF